MYQKNVKDEIYLEPVETQWNKQRKLFNFNLFTILLRIKQRYKNLIIKQLEIKIF